MLTIPVAVALLLAPEPIAITWDAPTSCPEADYLHERIAQQLHGVKTEATSVRAIVSPPVAGSSSWRLRIWIGADGERELEGDSCTALADAAIVMVAMSLNAASEAGTIDVPEPPLVEEPPPTPLPPLPPPTVAGDVEVQPTDSLTAPQTPVLSSQTTETDEGGDPAPSPSDLAPSSEPTERRARATLGVRAGLHGGGLPALGGGLGGHVGVRWGPLSAAVTGMHWFERERPVVGDVAATYRLSTGGLELCGALALGRAPAAFELVACGQAEAGGLRAEGRGASPSRVQRHPWIAVGAAVAVVWMVRPWVGLGLRADLVAPLLGRRFFVGDVEAGAVGPVDARGALGLEFRVPTIGPAS